MLRFAQKLDGVAWKAEALTNAGVKSVRPQDVPLAASLMRIGMRRVATSRRPLLLLDPPPLLPLMLSPKSPLPVGARTTCG